jgi:small-conductance mechanosensitive channel
MLLQQLTPTPSPPTTLREVFTQLQVDLLKALPGMFRGALVFLIFLLVAWMGRRIIALAAPRVRADTGAVLLLSRVYYYGIIIFGIVTALGAAGLNVSALVTGLGLTGFALGFALKDVLSNLLSGIMLLLYRPFNIGDHIRMGEYEGTIETIRMRDTLVRAADGRLIVVPNTKLITEVVVNNTYARQASATGDPDTPPPPRSTPAATEEDEYWQPPQH